MMNFLRKQMKWVMAIVVVAFLLSTFLMYEGSGRRRTPTVNADGTMSDYEVANINGRSLMRSELEQRLRNYLSTYSSRNVTSLDMPAIYKTVLDQAVLDSQLAKEVEEKGISVSDAEAEHAMKIYADTYYPTRETFYQALAQSGINVDDYKKSLARQMAYERLLSDAIGEVVISEDKAVEFYDTMKNLIYSKPEGFMIHMADFNTSADAEDFRAKLLAGESWEKIVSNDEVKSSDIINITKDPVFLPTSALKMGTLAVLESLDILQPSPVFEVASSDFAVGLKTSHVEESLTPYDEVSADIKNLLTQQEQRKRLSDYEESLRNKAQLTINDSSLFAATEKQPAPEIPDITPVETSKDSEVVSEEPEIKVETVSEEPKTEVKEVKEPVAVETVSEDVKTEVVTEEIKSPDVVEVEKVEEPAEPVSEEIKVEEVKSEVKSEDVEIKVEEKVEEVKQEIKPEVIKDAEEVKTESVEPVVSVEPVEQVEQKIIETVSEEVKKVEEITPVVFSEDK